MGKNIDNSAYGQTTVTKSNTQGLFTDTRDAFVSISQKGYGTAQFGQMDTIYKTFGNRIKMLGVDSSNFVSTSGVMSDVGWKAATGAVTSFNTRIGNQVRLLSEDFNGFSVGYSYRPDQNRTATQNQYLTAAGARWTNGTFYVGLAQEVHNDYRVFSGSGAVEATTTLVSANPGSRDTANRLSFGYVKDALQLSADFATLQYTENALSAGKFTGYKTNTYQVSAEYALSPVWTVSANHVESLEGTCTISGGAACTTTGLNGQLTSLGAKYNFDKNIGLFMLYAKNTNGANATFASSAQGGNVSNIAAGLLVVF
jgi:predicted porin